MKPLWLLYFATVTITSWAQPCEKLNLKEVQSYSAKCAEQSMTLTFDLRGEPFVYVANKEAGLRVLEMKEDNDLVSIATLPIDSFANLEVMGVSQYGDFLYLALGNFFSTKQSPGVAIIDVSNQECHRKKGFGSFKQKRKVVRW